MKQLYAVRDRVAAMMVGFFQVFPNDAAAVRWFGDVLGRGDTLPGMHPGDFELCSYAELHEHSDDRAEHIVGTPRRVVMSGEVWLAAQTQEKNESIRGQADEVIRRIG